MSDVDGLRTELAYALCFNRDAGYVTVATADLVAVVERQARERAAEALADLAQRFSELGAYGAYCVAKDRAERAAAVADDGQPDA